GRHAHGWMLHLIGKGRLAQWLVRAACVDGSRAQSQAASVGGALQAVVVCRAPSESRVVFPMWRLLRRSATGGARSPVGLRWREAAAADSVMMAAARAPQLNTYAGAAQCLAVARAASQSRTSADSSNAAAQACRAKASTF